MTAVLSSQAADCNLGWLDFVDLSGDEGRQWAALYRRHYSPVDLSTRALSLMRSGQLEAAYAVLDQFAAALEAMETAPPSIVSVMARFYHGAAAYYFYCIEDWARAYEAIDQANDAVVEAISREPFLILLAAHFPEFCLHRAKIARNQRRWDLMFECLDTGTKMITNAAPLCRTRAGCDIFGADMREFFTGLGPLPPHVEAQIQEMIDTASVERLFDRFVRQIVKLPGFAIPY
jgi:hypothetical protein